MSLPGFSAFDLGLGGDLSLLLHSPIRFVSRPSPVEPDMRLPWRVALLAVALSRLRGGKSSLARLRVLDWSLRTEPSRQLLLRALRNATRPEDVITRSDRSFEYALLFATAESLIGLRRTSAGNGRVHMLPAGVALVADIGRLPNCFEREIAFLNLVTPHLTEGWVSRMFRAAGEQVGYER